jgi:hypothetical protein
MKNSVDRNMDKSVEARAPYVSPHLRIVELSAEETLAIGCKLADGGSASGGFTCTSNACAQPGS